MQFNYKTRLFLYFFVVFALFTAIIVLYQQRRERIYKRQLMEQKLDLFSQWIESDSIVNLPKNLRITKIDFGGKVLFDNNIDSSRRLENHFNRPEINQAKEMGTGSDIRLSESLGIPFLYYARLFPNEYVRIAIPYDGETQNLLQSDKTFIILSILLFIIALFFLWMIARRFGQDLEYLKRDVVKEQRAKLALKTEMTSAIAHELRIPVSAIRGYTETMLDPDMDLSCRQSFIERTHAAAVRLSELLRDISLLTHIEEAGQHFSNEIVHLRQLVETVLDEFSAPLQTASIKTDVHIPMGITIYGNRTLITSIFQNLIENAVKYAGKWVSLNITLEREDADRYYFSVSDSGAGVAPQDLPRIFERFYRTSHSGRSREDGGSGLGLAIVRHAVMHHGGTITAENQSSGGLKISFSLLKKMQDDKE